ncbi:type VI secretion system Vgr family protein [Pseudomonas aeruginosa]|uniref:type VI secretion system Vgr family protein n=1 Tax=Pseudomonas aeruginosa TaxID=287 RepID=UPI003EBAA345
MALAQQTRLVRVDSPLGAEVLQLQRMEGREELGRPFAYELELISENPDLPLDGLLGKPASLALELHDGSRRHFHGIVAACSQGSGNGQFASYQVTLRPWLWLLTRTSDCRIFQNQKVPDIIKQVFRDLGFSDFEDALSRSYREWEYCVQYRETSFDFVSRLMEQEGIYYWFRHEQSRHILVLSDAYGAHQSPPNYASVPYYPPTLEQRERDHFYDWHMAREVQSGSLSLNDYDFQRPGARLEVRSNIARSHAAADYPLYDYPGEYVQSQDGEQYARTRIEALQARYERVRLRGRARGLGSGHLFKLSGYPREDQNREYLVVGAEYRVVQELYETGGGGVGAQFESELDCIDAGQAYRPLPTTPLPIVRGPQTAVVVGPKGEEIWTDQYGRVKVHFHWDRHDQSNENSSCWMRVSQAWAGKNWGSIQIPRIGQEVIVSFLEGDPDRPTIDHDETVHVKHDRTETVDNNETITIGVDRTEKVGNNEKISIGANRTEDVGSNETISIGVDRTEKVGSNEKISIGANRTEDVGNDETISIGANRSESVGNNETISIGADRSESVGANETIDIGGNQSTSIGKNESRSVGQGRDTSVGKDDSLDVGKSFTLNAGDSITLVTGAASIRMKKDGSIVISGKNITIDGSGAINVKADKNVVVKGRKILQN